MAILAFEPTYVSDSDDHGLGNVFFAKDGKAYRWVNFVDQDATISQCVYRASATAWDVTTDIAGGSAVATKGIGVTLGAVDISDKSYGFIQVAGDVNVRTDAGVAAGDAVVGHSVDGEVDTMADGEEELVFGWALAADDNDGYVASDDGVVIQLTGCL